MRSLVVLAALFALGTAGLVTAGCGGEREIILTRDELGESWPLRVNSATVLCSDEGGAVVKVGPSRYALDEKAVARGLPPAREIARDIPVDPQHPEIGAWPADTEPLRAACDTTAAVATQ